MQGRVDCCTTRHMHATGLTLKYDSISAGMALCMMREKAAALMPCLTAGGALAGTAAMGAGTAAALTCRVDGRENRC
jgi:hypothetical protein